MAPTHAELGRFKNNELSIFTHEQLQELTNYELIMALQRQFERVKLLPRDSNGYLDILLSFVGDFAKGIIQKEVKTIVLSVDTRAIIERLVEMLQRLGN